MTDDRASNGEIEEEPSDPDLPPAGDDTEHASEGSRNPAHTDPQERLRKMFESPGISAFIKQTAEQHERLRKMFESPAWLESVARVAEAYRRWDEGERRLLDHLAPRGWVISPSSSIADLGALVAT